MSLTSPTTDKRPASPALHASLAHARLPRWAPAAIAAGSVTAGIGLGLVAGWHSRVQWGMLAALFFVLATFAITTKVEGSRQGKDRVATSVVWVCFILALVPLLSLAWVTVTKGIKVIDGYFLTHSMSGLLDTDEGGGIYHALLGTLEQV
ncbi:phosphate ABC transporter permease PstA, partial [Streptomyces sp. NPDC003016]